MYDDPAFMTTVYDNRTHEVITMTDREADLLQDEGFIAFCLSCEHERPYLLNDLRDKVNCMEEDCNG